ncbi:MAG: hypothetical protein ACE5K9_02795 [Candidatus Methylomirabilales bacterium]
MKIQVEHNVPLERLRSPTRRTQTGRSRDRAMLRGTTAPARQ